MKKLIIITGHPGSGKTSIARQLSHMYAIPYVSKDAIKEHIFDTLGSKDKEWSLKVSAAAHRIMDDAIISHLETNNSIIVESNFKVDIDSRRFSTILATTDAECVQLLCVAKGEILFDRWVKRIENAERHEGHVEAIGLDQIKADLAEPYASLVVPGKLVTVDTTDFSKVEHQLRDLPSL